MTNPYKALFYAIYSIFKMIDKYGFSFETTGTRAQATVIFLSILELLNLMTLFPDKIVRDQIIVPGILILVFNFVLFFVNKNYAKIVLAYQEKPLSTTAKTLAFGYVILTIVAFAWTR